MPGDARQYERYSHVRGVGDSTLHFQGEAHRYHPDALDMASRFAVGADWPIAYAELERYYDLAEQQLGVAAPLDNPWRTRSHPPPLPAHRLSYASAQLAPAFATVGATLLPNALAILSQPYNGRPPCNYCNSCAAGAAGWVAVQHRRGASVRVGLDLDGRGIGAQSRRFPHGLANASGQVGRHLTESLSWMSIGLLAERVDAHRGVPIDATAWDFSVPGARADGSVGGFRLSTAHGAAGLRGPAAYATRLVPGFGVAHQRRLAEVFGHGVAVLAIGDWLPNAETKVDLDPWQTDAAGLPVARITSHLGDNERRLIKRMANTTRAVLDAAGAEIVEETSALDVFAATHVLGTCRMGRDPAHSVADADGFSHEVPNLAFADGALVPSSGSGDSPALTITALALRTADRLIQRVR